MNNKRQPEPPAESFNIGDIYFVLFRQKWIILSFFAAGLLGAVAVWFLKPAQYESEAKLYVQYVMDVGPSSQNPEESVHTTSSGASELIHTEIEFLTSQDLAYEVVDKVGADKILAKLGGGSNSNAAAAVVLKNLVPESVVTTPSVIRLTFQHPDQDVSREVLFNIVQAYVNKSADEHRPVQVSDDFLIKGTEHLRQELNKTETELNNAKKEAGVVSTLEETKKNWDNQINQLTSDIHLAGAELAARSASQPVIKSASTNTASTNNVSISTDQNIPTEALENYKVLSAGLMKMYDRHVDAITRLPAGSPFLKEIEDQITDLSQRKQALEEKYPSLTSISVQSVPSPNHPEAPAADPATDALAVKSLTAKMNYLNNTLEEIKQRQAKLASKEPEILELQGREKTQTAQIEYYVNRMQQLQLAGNQPNSGGIKPIESPTPAVKKHSKTFKKLMMMTLAGGAFGGLALAFLIEMVLDRSVKRPDEIEKKLKLPLFISIPDTNHNGHRRQAIALAANNRLLLKDANGEALVPAEKGKGKSKGKSNGTDSKGLPEELAPWDRSNVLHRFYAGLRDRLIVNFEVRNLNHNPKLVAVTSCRRGAGVSSIAAGLAASLSETGDGNVLLVDMRAAQGAAQQFHKGKPVCGPDTDLGNEINASMFGRNNSDEGPVGAADGDFPPVLSKKFATMMPKLKASDYDYIIFDMPPVSQTSMTPRLAGLMDMVLLVIESEKTNRDSVQRATALLSESKAQISTVLNKVRTYVPTRLHQEFLDDEA